MVMDKKRTAKIEKIAERFGVTNIRIFGSYATGTAKPDSDLDLLITLEPGHDLIDLIGFKQDVEEILGIKVDVVTEGALISYFRDQVLREAVAI